MKSVLSLMCNKTKPSKAILKPTHSNIIVYQPLFILTRLVMLLEGFLTTSQNIMEVAAARPYLSIVSAGHCCPCDTAGYIEKGGGK